jgi:phospholipid/cholesterol/gamma-HCH transport system substrate-binding protein
MNQELKVGITVLVSLVILIGGIMWGKGFRLRAKRYEISVLFTTTGGLENGANVLANGVIKGKVKNIEFFDGYVRVSAAVDEDVVLYSDFVATIEAPTVMAGQVLSLYTGTTPPRMDEFVDIKGTDPQGMTAIVAKMQDFTGRIEVTLSHLDSLLIDAHVLLGDTANQANLNKTLTNVAEMSQTSNEMLSRNRAQIEQSLKDLQLTLASARELTDKLSTRTDSTLNTVDSTLNALSGVATEVRDLLANINSGEGTVGKLFTDDELYLKLNRTLDEVDSLSYHLRTKGMRQKIVLF